MNEHELRKRAQEVAQNCIDGWAREGWYELNDMWGSEYTDEELLEIVRVASLAEATIPDNIDE